MATPTENAATSASQIVVDWTALTTTEDTGATPIRSYILQWDKNSSGTNWYSIVGELSNYEQTSYT